MSLLHFAIGQPEGLPPFPSTWGSGPPTQVKYPGIVSVLYSGIGGFYARCAPGGGTGWAITNLTTTTWSIDEGNDMSPPHVKLLSRDEAVQTAAADLDLLKRDLEAKGPSSCIHFAFQPAEAWCRFQMSQSDGHPLYLSSPPSIWGVSMPFQGETHFIVWKYDAVSSLRLFILSIRVTSETFPILFQAVKSVCQAEKHNTIEAWNLDETIVPIVHNLGGRTCERGDRDQLPAIKWYQQEVNWLGNSE